MLIEADFIFEKIFEYFRDIFQENNEVKLRYQPFPILD